MFKLIWLSSSLLVIVLILIQVPNNTGLESIASKTNFLGSPSSAEKFLTYSTWFCISIYIIFAIKFNLAI
jgi:protein translocase SecG subunit